MAKKRALKADVVFNNTRAKKIFSLLAQDWKAQTGPFRGVLLSEDQYPVSAKGLELANYFLYVAIPQRGGVDSDSAFAGFLDCTNTSRKCLIHTWLQNAPSIIAKRLLKHLIATSKS